MIKSNDLECQISNNETFVLIFVILILSFICNLSFDICHSYAEESKPNAAETLTKCICEGKTSQPVCLDELKDLYFKDNKYTDFVGLLKGICPENKTVEPAVNYYIAFARYSQLKYLEDVKNWDEYFAKGNEYRDDIVNCAQAALGATTSKDPLNIYSRLLLYQFHADQQDTFSEASLTELMSAVTGFAQSNGDMEVVRKIADKLIIYNESGKAKELYKIYALKLAGSDIKDAELRSIADKFYQDANLELAEIIYDIYIERISKGLSKEKLVSELTGVAKRFAYNNNAAADPLYAEKIFKKIEEAGGKESWGEELMYLRGFNLEKAKVFAQAKDVYAEFLKTFPQSNHADEAAYKSGVIFIYVLRDLKSGRDYLEQLARKEVLSPHALAALYQLGLLKQWEGELPAAKEYYDLLLEKTGNSDPEALAVIQERLNEINQGKPLEYNLKLGLDAALKEEFANLNMNKVSLESSRYLPERGQEVAIHSVTSLGPTGCLQVELQYLWSGDLGMVKPAVTQPEFRTSYGTPGTKLINMVLVAPEGITDRSIDLIDVH